MNNAKLPSTFAASSSARIISDGSLAVEHIYAGNEQGIRDMLSRREISVYDRQEIGWTYLHVGAKKRKRIRACAFHH